MADFAATIRAFAQDSRAKAEQFFQGVVVEVADTVIDTTPVDTGELVDGWDLAVGSRQAGLGGKGRDPSRAQPKGRIRAKAQGLKLGQLAFIVNDVEHGPFVEFGTARQPPRAFVRRAAASIPAISARVASRLRAGTAIR